MGLFKKKEKPPVAVGSAVCCVDADGGAFVGQQHHQMLTPEAVSALAPITWALFAAGGFSSRGPAGGQQWLQEVMAFGNPDSLVQEVLPAGVTPFEQADPRKQMEAVIVGSFFLSSSSKLAGSWSPKGQFDPDQHALPLLAGLVTAAGWLGQENEVWHALDGMASTEIDFGNPGVFTELPQVLLDYGAQQAAIENLKFPGPS